MEIWLQNIIPDAAIQLEGMTAFQADRDAGGGLCICINKDCYVNTTLATKHCSQLAEFLILKCWPFYLPRDSLSFTILIVAVVYIAPSAHAKANANETLGGLRDAISELLTKHPDSFVVVAGDFNHTSLKAVFPKFNHVVDFKTRRENVVSVCFLHILGSKTRVNRRKTGDQMLPLDNCGNVTV